jgi:hypothetical protein
MPRLELESLDLASAERRLVEAALDRAGSIVGAAALLGIPRNALKRRIIKHNIMWSRQSAKAVDPPRPVKVESLEPVPRTQAEMRASTAQKALSWLAVVAPRRLYNEEVGDALEVVAAMEKAGCPRYKIRLKVGFTIFWVLLNALRELIAGLKGQKSPHK